MKRYDSVCTICGARDLLPFGQRTDGIRVLRCAVCGHGIVEHFQDNVQSLYEDEYFSAVPDSAIGYEDYAAGAEQGVAWAASLLRILKPGGQVLDIGCADGRALQLLGEGYDCFGIELNDSMAQQATQAGVRIIARDLLDSSVEQRYAGCFDAVLSIAVFEHIPDFKEAFRTAAALLKPDGILIFEVPAVQFAGDVWYRSSLEHIHYPTESSIEYLFREILHLPLTGSVIDVQDFGGTYIGVTSPDAETARRAGYEYLRLTTSDPALLHGDEARFRWYLDLMHAAHSRPEILALYRHLKPEDWTAPSLHRLFELWAYREDKLTRIIEAQPREVELKTRQFAELMTTRQQELEDFARAKNWLEEQVQNWQQVAGQRQETLVAYEAAKAWLEGQVQNWQQVAGQRQETLRAYLEEQVRSWRQVAGQRQETLVAYEAGKARLEAEVRNWQQVAGQRQETLAAYEAAKAWLEEQVRNWQQVAGQRQETLVAYEAGKAWLEEQVRNWQQVAGQRQEALAAYEAGKARLEAEVRNWQQVAGQRQEALAAYEAGMARLEAEVRSWQQVAGQRQETLVAYEAGKAWLEAEVRNWQQVAGQRQEALAAYEAGKAWLEAEVRSWQQVAGQRQEALAAYEAGMARLEAEVRSWQQTSEVQRLRIAELESGKLALEGQLEDLARLEQELSQWQQIAGEAQESLARLEGRVNYLRAELEYWHQTAEERDRWIAELEKAKTWLAQHGDNWEAAAEQRSERIAVLEETIARMRATRAWRTAEWSAGVWRRISGICRGIMLVGSPRLASSNAKNFLLGLKLIFGGGERRAIWGAHFDADYYKSVHPDVARSGIHPWLHYLLCGYFENRNPSGSFDSAYYRSRYSDVRDAGINPLLHYAVFGRQEQRSQAPPLTPAAAKLPFPVPLETRPHRALFAAETAPHLEDNEAPLVSVVIPCFNYGQYVEQAIHSVLSQTFTNLEIIVVEGGSTDGTTPEVLRDLERRGLPGTRFVYRTESHLAGDNRNFGIGLARGRYVCCLDADDLIKPTYLEIAVFLAEFCGYDMVYPSVSCFGESDFRWLLCDPTWPEIADGNQTSTVAMLRRAAWEQAGGFRDWGKGERHVPEDWEFWVRLVGHGFRGKSIREPLMLYRAHGGGLWTTCGSTVEYHRQAIREANPQFFVDGFVPATASLERPAASWDNLIEPAGSHPPILIALPFITIGGAEKVFETLARSLIRRGYKVVVITTLVLAETIRDCTESFEAITPYLYPLPRVLQNQEDRWRDFLFYLLKRHQIGMILIAGCDFVYRLLPEITREFPQIAILDQLFNDEVHYHTNRRCAAYIDATFVPSPKLADKLISECGEQADKICVIPHGINIEEMAAPDAEFDSSRLPQHFRGKFLVSFFGRLSTEKAPADFVEIARSLRSYDEICFLMTGEGQERAAVLALIERYEMQDRIHAPGFVDNVRTLMALSDVVVVPSSLDGMPLVVFEAQACGKPVVASSVGSIPYVIADGETGLLCTPGDVNGFAERILKLWRSPELRRAIGDAARIWVRANHSAESMTSRYVEAFDRARSRARRTAATNCTGE